MRVLLESRCACQWKSREQDGAGCHLPQLVMLSDKAWGYPTGSSRVKMVLGGPRERCTYWPPLWYMCAQWYCALIRGPCVNVLGLLDKAPTQWTGTKLGKAKSWCGDQDPSLPGRVQRT